VGNEVREGLDVGEIGGGEGGDDAFGGTCRLKVDPDPRVGELTSYDGHLEHPGETDVGDEPRFPPKEAIVLDPDDPRTEIGRTTREAQIGQLA